ncbi:MAG: hypothetical protein ABIG89_06525 [Candidatus Woesearchaeota archaeon]
MHTKKWTKLITRRLAVQVGIAWNYGWGKLSRDRYNTGISNTLIYYDGNKTDYFVDKDELNRLNQELDRLLENPEFVHSMIPEAKEFVEDKYRFIKDIINDAHTLSNPKLAALYSDFNVHHAHYYTRMWMVFRICERIVNKVEDMLMKDVKDKEKVQAMSRIFSTPLKPNDVTNERIDMLKLAIKFSKSDSEEYKKELKQTLTVHTEKYQHIPMFDYDHEPFTYEHFVCEFDKIINSNNIKISNPIDELKKIEVSFENRKLNFDISLNQINGNKELYNLIKMLKKAVILRDHRDMVRQKLNLSLREFYKIIGARIGLSVEETALLTNKEIEYHLNASSNFDKE